VRTWSRRDAIFSQTWSSTPRATGAAMTTAPLAVWDDVWEREWLYLKD